MDKEVFKQLVLLHQSHNPFPLTEREERLPLHAEQIYSIGRIIDSIKATSCSSKPYFL